MERLEDDVVFGTRMLAWAAGPPALAVRQAVATVDILPARSRRFASVAAVARLDLVAHRTIRSFVLAVPAPRVLRRESGAVDLPRDWTLETLDAGPGATWALLDPPPTGTLASAAEHQRVRVTLDTPLAREEHLSVQVAWSQTVPYARVERAGTAVNLRGQGTALLPVLPLLEGDDGHFPYTLEAWTLEGALPVLSGGREHRLRGRPGHVGVRARGREGSGAAVAVGPWVSDEGRRARTHTQRTETGLAAELDRLAPVLRAWTGWTMDSLDLVEVPPSWGPPEAHWGDGLAALATGLRPPEGTPMAGRAWSRLPGAGDILIAEAAAEATIAGAAGRDPAAQTWIEGLSRAFALNFAHPADALAWRETLQRCVVPDRLGPRALSPEATATSGFRELSARCAVPLVLGTMLDDRIGAPAAERVRRRVLAPGAVDAQRWVDAVVEEDPTAAGWAQRWLVEGHVARIRVDWTTTKGPEGVRVEGRVVSDSPLADAPVTVRFGTGPGANEVLARGSTPFTLDLAHAPRRAVVDPDHRLLAVGPTTPGL